MNEPTNGPVHKAIVIGSGPSGYTTAISRAGALPEIRSS